jgi:hypothetical protein
MHWLYCRQDGQPLGGRNAIGRLFQRKETYLAVYSQLKHFTFIGHW